MAASTGSKVCGGVTAVTFVLLTLTYLTSRNISSSTVRAINEGYRSVMSPLFQQVQQDTSNISTVVREEVQNVLEASLEKLEAKRVADIKAAVRDEIKKSDAAKAAADADTAAAEAAKKAAAAASKGEEISEIKSAIQEEIKQSLGDKLEQPLQEKMDDIFNVVRDEKDKVENALESFKISQQPGNSDDVKELAKKLEDLKIAEVKAQELESEWQGFGPEKGQYNFTVVAAMMDIGRGSWPTQKRTYTEYLHNMKQVLKLDVNIVMFVDIVAKQVVDKIRKGREHRTAVTVIDFKSLPYYRYKDRMAAIMATEEYKTDNELYDRHLCESIYEDYDILQLSKLYFMDRAARENPFSSDYLMWLDGGYGHGHDVLPSDHIWRPRNLLEFPNQVTFIHLMDKQPEEFRDVKDRLPKMHISILAGLFFGAGREVFKELYAMQVEEVERWLEEGIVDDDQTMYMMLYFRKPELFRWVRAGWYDVFRAFQHEPPQQADEEAINDEAKDEEAEDEKPSNEESNDASKDEETKNGEGPKDDQKDQSQQKAQEQKQVWPKEGEVEEIQEQEEVDEDPVEKQV